MVVLDSAKLLNCKLCICKLLSCWHFNSNCKIHCVGMIYYPAYSPNSEIKIPLTSNTNIQFKSYIAYQIFVSATKNQIIINEYSYFLDIDRQKHQHKQLGVNHSNCFLARFICCLECIYRSYVANNNKNLLNSKKTLNVKENVNLATVFLFTIFYRPINHNKRDVDI